MSKGKNKQISKKGKVAKKGDRHPFTKKEWFQVMAPPALKQSKQVGWTCCKKPVGTQIISDFLKSRVAEISYADISNEGKDVNKKIKIQLDDIVGNSCFTSFYEYELCREKIASMLKKRQTLIEVVSEVKSKEGVLFRVILVAVTSKRYGQQKINSYAQSSKVRLFRKKVNAELAKIAAEKSANDFVNEVVTDAVNVKIEAIGAKIIPGIKLTISKLKISKKNITEIRNAQDDLVEDKVAADKKIKENPKANIKL
jgi:small subunit ribosomal protein S3Ae